MKPKRLVRAGHLPRAVGQALREPLYMIYGLLMLFLATGDLYLIWRTRSFPAHASFNNLVAQDEVLQSFAQLADP